ncbi:MAG: tRNA pseudouridine(13) synthase TruD, partial [Pseudomonadales bacterium]|nr:tRNA pseudouridine(13) synthase TruD [Pseudomonadales bacterium]
MSNDPAGVYYSTGQLPYTYGKPALVGAIRSRNEDFVVTEQLGFVPSGAGEHLWHWVEKRGLTSLQVRDELAALYNCAARDIGMAGLKDKYACTRQWFSVPVPQAHSIANAGTVVEHQQGRWSVRDLQR